MPGKNMPFKSKLTQIHSTATSDETTSPLPRHSNYSPFNGDNNSESSPNHKFYGCKKKDISNNYCESFGLPDDPIFSNSPICFDKVKKSPLDTDPANPWDLCVVSLNHIDQPWLIENQEVITPYWDVESLFSFKIDDIRRKIEPDNIDFYNDSSEFSEPNITEYDADRDKMFTSTPQKVPGEIMPIVSTINITSTEDNVNTISALKNQVLKALEEAIKSQSSLTNFDMKIQIVADLSKSPENTSLKPCVEVRINETGETESCKSSASSKENYFIPNSISLSVEDEKTNQDVELHNSAPVDPTPVKKRRKKRMYTPSRHRNLRSFNVDKNPEIRETNVTPENHELQFENPSDPSSNNLNESILLDKPQSSPGKARRRRRDVDLLKTYRWSDTPETCSNYSPVNTVNKSLKILSSSQNDFQNVERTQNVHLSRKEGWTDRKLKHQNTSKIKKRNSHSKDSENIVEKRVTRRSIQNKNHDTLSKIESESDKSVSDNLLESSENKIQIIEEPMNVDSHEQITEDNPENCSFLNHSINSHTIESTDHLSKNEQKDPEQVVPNLKELPKVVHNCERGEPFIMSEQNDCVNDVSHLVLNHLNDNSLQDSTSSLPENIESTVTTPLINRNELISQDIATDGTSQNICNEIGTEIQSIVFKDNTNLNIEDSMPKNLQSVISSEEIQVNKHVEKSKDIFQPDSFKKSKKDNYEAISLELSKELNLTELSMEEQFNNKRVKKKVPKGRNLLNVSAEAKRITRQSLKNKYFLSKSLPNIDSSQNDDMVQLQVKNTEIQEGVCDKQPITEKHNNINNKLTTELKHTHAQSNFDDKIGEEKSDCLEITNLSPVKPAPKQHHCQKSKILDDKDTLDPDTFDSNKGLITIKSNINHKSNGPAEIEIHVTRQGFLPPQQQSLQSTEITNKPESSEEIILLNPHFNNNKLTMGPSDANILEDIAVTSRSPMKHMKKPNRTSATHEGAKKRILRSNIGNTECDQIEDTLNSSKILNDSSTNNKLILDDDLSTMNKPQNEIKLVNNHLENGFMKKYFVTDSSPNVLKDSSEFTYYKPLNDNHKLPKDLAEVSNLNHVKPTTAVNKSYKQRRIELGENKSDSLVQEPGFKLQSGTEKGISEEHIEDTITLEKRCSNNDTVEKLTPKRILRSSNQGWKENVRIETSPRKKRTISNSIPDDNFEANKNKTPDRRRCTSINLTNNSIRNSKTRSPSVENSSFENTTGQYIHQHLKIPKISFGSNETSIPNSSREVKVNSFRKSILKNIGSDGSFGPADNCNSTFQEKVEHVSTLQSDDIPQLFRQDCDEALVEKEDDKLKENGITSRVRVVISPFDVKEEEDEDKNVDRECPILPVESPPEKKVTRQSSGRKQKTSYKLKCPNIVDSQDGSIIPAIDQDDKKDVKPLCEMKIEKSVYNVGDIVWAQVAKYPFWPAIICQDPLSGVHFNEVRHKNTFKTMYHIRFFGDYGRRSWVNRVRIILYCSKADLELIALRLKSENKNQSLIKSYVVSARYRDKWNKGIEEVESLKHRPSDDVINHLIHTFETVRNERKRKRTTSIFDASESESEETDTEERPRKKRYSRKFGDQNISFDEITISACTKPDIAISTKQEGGETSERITRKSVRGPEILEVSQPIQKKESSEINRVETYFETPGNVKNTPKKSECQEPIKGVVALPNLNKKQPDEISEAGSKISSDSSISNANTYSFENQFELHKRNNLFNGLTKIKVCEYCLKQGDLHKCKGRCSGYYHIGCASHVMQPRPDRRKKERNPNKIKLRPSFETSSRPKRSSECCITRSYANQTQCQIITIKSKHQIDAPKKDNLPDNFHEMSIADQIDYGMKEMMSKFENQTIYHDIGDSSSEEGSCKLDNSNAGVGQSSDFMASTENGDKVELAEGEKSADDAEVSMMSESSTVGIRHVTADCVLSLDDSTMDVTNLKCAYCRLDRVPPCFSCGLEVSKRGDTFRQKCSQHRCGRFYHPHCLKMWPQTQWSIGKWSKTQPEDLFTCPAHTCHTCFSEELGSTAACRLPGDRLGRCLLCPATFHTTTFCTPAGSDILGGSQIICPRHRSRPIQPINTGWCFICSEGGNLICCDICPTSVHPECQPVNFTEDDKYICEDCESGRFPLYDEIVWVKLGSYRWWPAIVLFPNEVPENVWALKHQRGDFAVKFFGTNDHYWVNKARSFLFQEGDTGDSPADTKLKYRLQNVFKKAIEEASIAYKFKREFKLRREAECINNLKPPPYTRINKNKPVGNVKSLDLDLSNAVACDCNANKPHPCGTDSNCINRLLLTECDANVCPAGSRCRNQAFQKREYPPMVPYKTQGRGWGLKTLAPIKTGQFVIEYVGELIDSEEYQRRIKKMHEKKEENYYFMTVDSDRMIDAGPKGNLSRFMNHSCNPNCVTQKWTVTGDTRVGLFAKCDIETGSELTFNYNLEVVGQEKKVCKCGASNCSGFIGVKAKLDKPEKSQTNSLMTSTESRKSKKNRKPQTVPHPLAPPCFLCGRKKSDITCNNKFCSKGYHLKCLKLEEMPEASKYACPRHNCNICSNRTIRCCVKCTNSFCPSHSEGNVRHDKFLGFVCRLHDPGISSTDASSDVETPQHPVGNKKRHLCKTKRSSSLIDMKPLRSAILRKKELAKLKTQSMMGFDIQTTELSTVNMDSTVRPSKRKRRDGKRRVSLTIEEREILRAKWRLQGARARSRKKARRLLAEKAQQKNTEMKEGDPNWTFSLEDTASRVCVEADGESNFKDNTFDAGGEDTIESHSEVTPPSSSLAEKSEFESFKSTKRRRSRLDTTDESAVSSTTSDEGSKSPRIKQLNFNLSNEGKDDQVSSSPVKINDKLSQQNTWRSQSSESGKRKSKDRFKKIRLNVHNLTRSTAKPS